MTALASIEGGRDGNLAAKMAQIMGELTTIEKRGEFKVDNKLRYTFVRAVDSYEAVQKRLAERGIALLAEDADIVDTREKGNVIITTVKVTLRLHDSRTSETMVAKWLGSGQDTAEKGVAKAITGAVKSWLLTTFLIPSGLDPDEDGQSGRGKAAASKPTADERKGLAVHLKAYALTQTDETQVRIKLKQLGAGDVTEIAGAVNKLNREKALALYKWLDDELVKRQGAKA